MNRTDAKVKPPLEEAPYFAKLVDANTQNVSEMAENLTMYFPMVRYLARRIHKKLPNHVELDELVGAGMLGLVDAARRFVPAKQVQFKSYAQFRVRGAIIDCLRSLDWGPRELRRKGRLIEVATQLLTKRYGRNPTDSEMAIEMQLTVERYQQLVRELKSLDIGTLNAERSSESGEEEISFLANPDGEDPLYQCIRKEIQGLLTEAIGELPERERLVLSLYYTEELTMKQIGKMLEVVESRVSQIHSSAVARLRKRMVSSGKQNTSIRAAVRRPSPDR